MFFLDEDRYFDVAVDYGKAEADDICIRMTRDQPRPGRLDAAPAADALVPRHLGWRLGVVIMITALAAGVLVARHDELYDWCSRATATPRRCSATVATNTERLWGSRVPRIRRTASTTTSSTAPRP